MHSTIYRFHRLFFLFILLFPAISSLAAETTPADPLGQAEHQLNQLEKSLPQHGDVEMARLSEYSRQANAIKSTFTQCIRTTRDELHRLTLDLEGLQPEQTAPDQAVKNGEGGDIAQKRGLLGQEAAKLEKHLTRCRSLSLRAKKLLISIHDIQEREFEKYLLTPGPTLVDVIRMNLAEGSQWLVFIEVFALEGSGLNMLSAQDKIGLGVILITAMLVGLGVRFGLREYTYRRTVRDSLAASIIQATLCSLASYAPYLITSIAVASSFYRLQQAQQFTTPIAILSYGLVLYYLLAVLISIVLSPPPPAKLWLQLPESVAHALGNRLRVLALLLLIGFLLFATLLVKSFPEPSLLLVRDVYAGFLTLNLVWITWLAIKLPKNYKAHVLGTVLTLLFTAALAAEWLGYRTLAGFMLLGLTGTLLPLAFTLLLLRLLEELFDGLDEGRYRWQRSLRRVLGVRPEEYIPGLNWLRILTNLALWAGLVLWILRAWGLSDTGFILIRQYFAEGFQIGSMTLVPGKVLWALLVFALLLTLSRWFRQMMARQWVYKLRIDRGAREAIIAASGYVSMAIIILISLSVAGIDFAKLAIVAGALSVGIGFGLQNIVNNFVSGLILLLERPIRTGDVISVGSAQGTVKRINIRYTLIQNADREDVIIPNSVLIAGQLTNSTLSDHLGLLRIKLDVAYGANTEMIKQLLLEVANAHPLVLKGHHDVADPKVYFMAFGEHALNFELRCYIRDVDKKLSATSEINFAIDAAFRAHGIQSPIPRRALHIHAWPAAPAAEITALEQGQD